MAPRVENNTSPVLPVPALFGIAVKDDPDVMADKIAGLMDDPDLLKKLGDNGRGIVEKELSNRVEAGRLLDLYTSVGFK